MLWSKRCLVSKPKTYLASLGIRGFLQLKLSAAGSGARESRPRGVRKQLPERKRPAHWCMKRYLE